MGDFNGDDPESLRTKLAEAEAAAYSATRALLAGLLPRDARLQEAVELLASYCHECPDPFQSLEIDRLLRSLVEDVDSNVYSRGALHEWARAEIRIQSLAARISRVLRDQGALRLEQAIVELSIIHLRHLEEGPMYPVILGEMDRLLRTTAVAAPTSLLGEFFGLARNAFLLPTEPAIRLVQQGL